MCGEFFEEGFVLKELAIRKKYVGDRAFYKMIMGIAVPMMIQNGISSFVSALDNLMIGRVGTNALSGVAISNQLIFVFNLLIFGASAGVGIFTAQYYGMKDMEGVRFTFRFKVLINTFLSICSILVLLFFSGYLISRFLQGEGTVEDAEETLKVGQTYMRIMLLGLIPVGVSYAYAGTLREMGETKAPMVASFLAIVVNLVGNVVLIYGFFFIPALGAAGAAIATVISRFVELTVLAVYTAKHSDKYSFVIGAFTQCRVPLTLCRRFIIKSLPLIANETLWALGQTIKTQSFSFRSLDAVAALNIQSTIGNLLSVAFLALGEAVGIVVGQILGSGDIEKAKDHARKMIAANVFLGIVFGLLLCAIAPLYPQFYKTTDEIKHMATLFILINGGLMPLYAFTHASYFTIRSGGNTGITLVFDCCFEWLLAVPAAILLSRYTNLSVFYMLLIVQSLEIIKCIIGWAMVHSGIWAKSIAAR